MADLAQRLLVPLLVLLFCTFFLYSISGMSFEARVLPQALIAALAIISLYGMMREVSAWKARHDASDEETDTGILPGKEVRIAIVVATTALYIAALPYVGFYIAAAGFVAVTFCAFRGSFWPAIPFVAGVVGAFYVLFEYILVVQLPGSL